MEQLRGDTSRTPGFELRTENPELPTLRRRPAQTLSWLHPVFESLLFFKSQGEEGSTVTEYLAYITLHLWFGLSELIFIFFGKWTLKTTFFKVDESAP